jgi:fatty-acyl-CoA synthase
MPRALADGIHIAGTFARAGMLAPSRPDRTLRALVGLHRWGPTLAAGYLGAAARYPDATAIIDELGAITFADIDLRTNGLARGFAGHGVRPGQGVAIMCRNHRRFVEASIACSKLGAHAIYLNTSFAGPQVTEVVSREAPTAIVYDEEFSAIVSGALEGRTGFLAWTDGDPGDRPTLAELAASRSHAPLPPPPDPGRSVILTSGTTGTPKGANRASPSSLGPAAALLAAIPLHARETTVIAAPLFHAWGFAHMFLSTALSSTLVLQRRFTPEDTLRAVAEPGASALVVVPVMLQRMLELSPEARRAHDTSCLRIIAASGPARHARDGCLRRQALQPLRFDRGRLGVDRHPRGSPGRSGDGGAPAAGHGGQDPRRSVPRGEARRPRSHLRGQRAALRGLHRGR